MPTLNYTQFGDFILFGYVGMKTFCHVFARSNILGNQKPYLLAADEKHV